MSPSSVCAGGGVDGRLVLSARPSCQRVKARRGRGGWRFLLGFVRHRWRSEVCSKRALSDVVLITGKHRLARHVGMSLANDFGSLADYRPLSSRAPGYHGPVRFHVRDDRQRMHVADDRAPMLSGPALYTSDHRYEQVGDRGGRRAGHNHSVSAAWLPRRKRWRGSMIRRPAQYARTSTIHREAYNRTRSIHGAKLPADCAGTRGWQRYGAR